MYNIVYDWVPKGFNFDLTSTVYPGQQHKKHKEYSEKRFHFPI